PQNKQGQRPWCVLAASLGVRPGGFAGDKRGKNRGRPTHRPRKESNLPEQGQPDQQETTSLVWDGANVVANPRNGLYGAVIVGPKGSKYRDPVTGADLSQKNSWQADVIVDTTLPEHAGKSRYRAVALFFQDDDNIIGPRF